MKIWIARHGQTDLNKKKLMQGRVDEPLNETGIRQAEEAADSIHGMTFDAVYSSPLQRAVATASLISGFPKEKIVTDERITETDFGPYDKRNYYLMGPAMTLYWACPEIFPAPAGVERIDSMVARSRSFLADLEKTGKDRGYENVLVVCHGGIIRALCGVLEYAPRGIRWRPKPGNCELRVYEV